VSPGVIPRPLDSGLCSLLEVPSGSKRVSFRVDEGSETPMSSLVGLNRRPDNSGVGLVLSSSSRATTYKLAFFIREYGVK